MIPSNTFLIAAEPWSLETLKQLLQHPGTKIGLSEEAKTAIRVCRAYLNQRMQGSDEAVYGINTGFGALRDKRISSDKLEELQYNLIRSHACGAGFEIPGEIVRLMLLLKVRSLSFGHSGVQVATAQRLLDFYNEGVQPIVYSQGSLGASGDLAPLAHLCLPLIGEGEAWYNGQRMSGAELLAAKGWEPIRLQSKEALALLNGTQFMLAFALDALLKAERLADQADTIAALSLEAFDGRIDPFHAKLHEIRPHSGQIKTAAHMRSLLEGSELIVREKRDVQDPYSFRCVPQVHGASRDVLDFCEKTIITEVNSTTDNPNVFVEDDLILSGGNFHGQPLAMALDLLAIAMAELGSISERRTYQLMGGLRGLPAFLAVNPGLESGMMIAQYTAAGIVSANKQFCTPAVIDSIPSSNGQEDHVSMGANAAVKCHQVVDNVFTVLGIELMCASQALHFRLPAKTSQQLQKVLDHFREVVPVLTTDRFMQPDIARAKAFVAGQ